MPTGRGKPGHMIPKASLPAAESSVYQLPERKKKMQIKVAANQFTAGEIMDKDLSGQTAQEFADSLFEFEYCSECGEDADKHTAVIGPTGNWFAYCDTEAAA